MPTNQNISHANSSDLTSKTERSPEHEGLAMKEEHEKPNSEEERLATQAVPQMQLSSMTMQPLTKHIPTEIWLNICSALLQPRVLRIQATASNAVQLSADEIRIPGPLFVDSATKIETLKTHRVAFADVLSQPVLFNPMTDIVLFTNILSLDTFLAPSFGLGSTSRYLRTQKQQVRFLAFDCSEHGVLGYPPSFDDTDRILDAIYIFGTVEKCFLVGSKDEDKEAGPKLANWKKMFKLCLDNYFGMMKEYGTMNSSMGIPKQGHERNIVEIILVNHEYELLGLTSG